jgi:hypothetical protein
MPGLLKYVQLKAFVIILIETISNSMNKSLYCPIAELFIQSLKDNFCRLFATNPW